MLEATESGAESLIPTRCELTTIVSGTRRGREE